MEYGIRIASLESASKSPGELIDAEFCDAGFWELCPDAPVTALYFGSEFCQELLPAIHEATAFCALSAELGFDAILLTPLVTQKGLNRLDRLLNGLAERGHFPAVVFNDWGVLELLRQAHPLLRLRMGRLMNRGLRDPRLDMRSAGPAGENTERGAGIRKLARSLGVSAMETDADLEPGYLGAGGNGLERTLHLPFTFVTSGRNCLEKAAAAPATKGIFTQVLNRAARRRAGTPAGASTARIPANRCGARAIHCFLKRLPNGFRAT